MKKTRPVVFRWYQIPGYLLQRLPEREDRLRPGFAVREVLRPFDEVLPLDLGHFLRRQVVDQLSAEADGRLLPLARQFQDSIEVEDGVFQVRRHVPRAFVAVGKSGQTFLHLHSLDLFTKLTALGGLRGDLDRLVAGACALHINIHLFCF